MSLRRFLARSLRERLTHLRYILPQRIGYAGKIDQGHYSLELAAGDEFALYEACDGIPDHHLKGLRERQRLSRCVPD